MRMPRTHPGIPSTATGLRQMVESESAHGMSDLVLSGFLHVVTKPRGFDTPMPIPAECRWEIFGRLCRETGVKGNLVPDAYFAALAIESGSEWITTDRDYSRFPGLRWRHPVD